MMAVILLQRKELYSTVHCLCCLTKTLSVCTKHLWFDLFFLHSYKLQCDLFTVLLSKLLFVFFVRSDLANKGQRDILIGITCNGVSE